MKNILLQNGQVFKDDQLVQKNILIFGTKIIKIGNQLAIGKPFQTIDCSGLQIFPGGIDPHVYLHSNKKGTESLISQRYPMELVELNIV